MRRPITFCALAALALGVGAVQQVTRAGRYLYTADGSRFYIKGVAYQEQGVVVASSDNPNGTPSTFTDPLANSTACNRDLPFLQQLGVNTIRAYSVNASLNHDSCMAALSSAGIYTIIDLSLPLNGSIDTTSPSWSTNILDLYIETIDAFSGYDNVLAFNVGNEVVMQNSTGVAPYIKAAARDIKAYLASKGKSTLVGYADIDGDPNWRGALADYLSCDLGNSNSGSTAIDLFGLNNYEWCGNSSFDQAYAGVHAQFASYNVPAYFSEFGCVTAGTPRPWTDVGSLFSSQMTDVWSGGLAFSYFPAESPQGEFGMVTISADGSTVTTAQDFANLKAAYASASPANSPSSSSAGNTNYPACPSANSTFVASSTIPPTPNESACSCLEQSLTCQFKPSTSNYTAIVGTLIDTACGLLGASGGNCNDISGNGTAGSYGRVSGCDPTVKLSFAMSLYYEANGRAASACDFSGNATVNANAPSNVAAANAVASSCISSPTATFTPSAPASEPKSGSSSGSSSSSSSSHSSGAIPLFGDARALAGVGAAAAMVLFSGLWTLA
ncbi:carbohydrate-binding module family 43 protein [Plicaturopsis crispa FD-325 SS-3]|nr:carbohydrate-binding module family 43 protein [Plicaturopsis crispa FD-325 SS-3]